MAEPAPLGLLGFATGTIAIGYVLSGFTPATASAQVATASVLLIFAGITQLLAGMWAFRKGNTFAATAFGAYGANNMVVAVFFLMTAIGVFAKNFSTNVVLSIELFCFAYISLMLTAAAVIGHIGGYFLILSALLAFYAGSALVINAVHGRTVLPLFGQA